MALWASSVWGRSRKLWHDHRPPDALERLVGTIAKAAVRAPSGRGRLRAFLLTGCFHFPLPLEGGQRCVAIPIHFPRFTTQAALDGNGRDSGGLYGILCQPGEIPSP